MGGWRYALTAAAVIGLAHAQAPSTFEVSSAVAGRDSRSKISRTPQRLTFQTARVGDIIAFAWQLPLDRIERRPQWMYDNVFNVALTTSSPSGLPEQRVMLQKLLAERFGLVAHRTSNESAVYFLVSGPNVKLTPAEEPGSQDLVEFQITNGGGSGFPGGLIADARHASMADLAAWLYTQIELPVLDKTGIAGSFDIEILRLPTRGGSDQTIQAVRDTLGLDLQRGRGTAESLIIDRAEQPK